MADSTMHTLRGKVSFAKVLNWQLGLNYNKDGKEWKVDIEITEDDVKELKKLKLGHRIKRAEPRELDDGTVKEAYLGGRPYLSFNQAEFKKDGSANQPWTIKDILGQPWDQRKEIGNGSVVDFRFVIMDGAKNKKTAYLRSLRVLEHVPYERKEFKDIDESDPYYQAALEAQAEAKAKAATSTIASERSSDKEFKKDFNLEDELDDDIEDVV
jgi:hypothetical protein